MAYALIGLAAAIATKETWGSAERRLAEEAERTTPKTPAAPIREKELL